MAKITDLLLAGALDGAEALPIVQGRATRRVSLAALVEYMAPRLPGWIKGDAGAASNTRMTLAQLKAASIDDVTSLYDGSVWTFRTGDFTATPVAALNCLVVASDRVPLDQGAWVREQRLVDIRDFGARFDNLHDDTSAWAMAIDYLDRIGGGVLQLPSGISRVGSIGMRCRNAVPISIAGPGSKCCYIDRIGNASTSLFRAYGADDQLVEPHFLMRGFTVRSGGRLNGAALQLDDIARVRLEDVAGVGGSVGIEMRGTLTSELYKCIANDNVVGVRMSRKNAFPNALTLYGLEARSNYRHGVDFADGEALTFVGRQDISGNGIAGDPLTGGVVIRASAGSEGGFGTADLSGLYLEGNKGTQLYVENATGLHIIMHGGGFYGSEAGRCATIGACSSFSAEDLIAGAPDDHIAISARAASLRRGVIAYPEMLGDSWERVDVATVLGIVNDRKGIHYEQLAGASRLLRGRADLISGEDANSYDEWLYGPGSRRFWTGGARMLEFSAGRLGLYGAAPVEQPVVTGALSAVTDPAAREVLSKLVAGLAAIGAVGNQTS